MKASIMEEREELMVSPKGNLNPTLKHAHFLKPSYTSSIHDLQPPFHHLQPPLNPITEHSLNISFNGSKHPQTNWKNWVTHMHSMHQTIWKQVGIHDAILNSTYKINIKHDLILSFSDKWCCQTNTFAFPWGEVTITLEDMMFLGGYSVLGDSVFSHPENTEEIKALEELEKVRKEFNYSRSKKVPHGAWLSRFMYSDTRVEHEAFLALWLSRFVFPKSKDTVSRNVLPIAVRLARGTKVALAPAVLASIYKDLRLMKEKLNESRECNKVLSLVVWSPMQLVQIWILERFPTLKFKPDRIENVELPFARWSESDMNEEMNCTRAVSELGSEDFSWCPYGLWPCKFYNVKEGWVLVDLGLEEELESFARCLRVSELVGIDCSCMEQYLPHRVAMQFGLGQDIPSPVARANGGAEISWKDYTRPIGDVGLYFPSRFFEPCATTRYLNWWNCLGGDDTIKKSLRNSMVPDPKREKLGNLPLVPPGFSPKRCSLVEVSSSSKEGNIVQSERVVDECKDVEEDVNMAQTETEVIVPPSFPQICPSFPQTSPSFPQTCRFSDEPSVQSSASSKANNSSMQPGSKGKKSDNVLLVPPGFSPMCPIIEANSSSDEGQQANTNDAKNMVSGSIKSSVNPPIQKPSSTMADYEVYGKGNIVQSEKCNVEKDVNKPKNEIEIIVPPSFPQTCRGSDETSVHSSYRSILPYPKRKKSENLPLVPPGFSPRCPIIEVNSSSDEGQQVKAKNSSVSRPMETPSSTMADHEAFGTGNIVQSEKCGVEEDVNKPKTAAEVIVPPNFLQACGSDKLSSEMESVVRIKESKRLSGDMSVSEKEAVNQNIVHLEKENGESSSLHESEILRSRLEGRIRRLEKIVAYRKAAKLGHRLD